ncbi:MAG TPA: ABC transporter permease, partial [Candidatus Paceibacterota bacterium]
SDYLIILPGKETNPLSMVFGAQKFRERDLMDLEKISGVKLVLPMDVAMLNIEYQGEKKVARVQGGNWAGVSGLFESSRGVTIESGAWPQEGDNGVAVLGYLVAHEMFKDQIHVGDTIIIKAKRMRVAGIVSKIGAQDDDNSIYISPGDYRMLTGSSSGALTAFVKVQPGANIDLVALQVKSQLSQQEVVRDFSVLTPETTERLAGDILLVVELVFMAIALISLVVGAVGVMNSTYTSVLERTKQIGIMKAIGATDEAVLSLFLIESGMIGLVGGFIGIICGVALSAGVGLIGSWAGFNGLFTFASLDYFGLLAVFLFTFVVGILSGLLPARQASEKNPVEALRYE